MAIFTAGEIVTATRLNNVVKAGSPAGSGWDWIGGAFFGSAADQYAINTATSWQVSTPALIDWTPLVALATTVQWRVSTVFNVSAILGGGGTLPTWTAKVQTVAIQASAVGPSANVAVGSAQAIGNSTGYKAADSGWQTAPVADVIGLYHPVWRSDRTGGTAGSITNVTMMIQVRCI